MIAVSPDEKSAYVAADDLVSQYSIDPSTGRSRPRPRRSWTTPPQELEPLRVNPDGKSAYVANIFANTVSQYSIDPSTGALSPRLRRPSLQAKIPTALRWDSLTPTLRSVQERRLEAVRLQEPGPLRGLRRLDEDLRCARASRHPSEVLPADTSQPAPPELSATSAPSSDLGDTAQAMSQEDVEVVKSFYAAWSRGEIRGPSRLMEPDIEYVDPRRGRRTGN